MCLKSINYTILPSVYIFLDGLIQLPIVLFWEIRATLSNLIAVLIKYT